MSTTMHTLKPAQTAKADEALAEIASLLSQSDQALSLSDGQGGQVALPAEVVDAFRQVIAALETRKPTVFYPQQALLTTQQAADFLGVSRPYLIRLLDEGRIPYSLTGSHRRIAYEDALAYMKIQDVERRRALKRLTRLSEELGLYDHDD